MLSSPASPTRTRKKHHCRTCGSPMKGHKRKRGLTVCPLSPPPSPTPKTLSSLAPSLSPPPISDSLTELPEIPPCGYIRRQNPNWVSPLRRPIPLPRTSTRESLVPTEPASEDGKGFSTKREWSQLERLASSELEDGHDGIFDKSPHLASIYSTQEEDLPLFQHAAADDGLHIGWFRSPRRALGKRISWWTVVGRSEDTVKHLTEMHQRMPGTIVSDHDQWTTVGLLQLCMIGTLAGILGGSVVVYGLSLL